MTGKFIRRTLRNTVLPNRPYFAHLAITHRCNLRCRFCHITETPFEELDTESTKRMIDVLDRAGVAVISISGGGEPLLRDDFDEIINYAAGLGLYVKVTSNGTMPRAKYERLLRSGAEEIGISLDGVRGHDLPFSHVGSPILSTLRYLNGNLPPGKKLTINVTVSGRNRSEVREIAEYCAREYPRARVWLNPVVVGEGALRTSAPARTEPDYLRECKAPTLLKANFYTEGAEEQYREERFDWGCLAGDQFFDVKPNGDFWLCQDQPSPAPLNVLEPDFEKKRASLDKGARRECSGCVYSCYYMVQQSFRPRNWRSVALLWWNTRTEPGGPERRAGERFGWVAGLCALLMPRMARRLERTLVWTALFMLPFSGLPRGAVPELASDVVLDRMEETGQRQQKALATWTSVRVYRAANQRLGKWANVRAEVRYDGPGRKSYRVLEENGSAFIARHVIYPILEAERDSSKRQAMVDINRTNYELRPAGFDSETGAYVFEAMPRKPNRYQFRGRIWVDARSFGIRRVEGQPAMPPSFWVKRTEFIHNYEEVGGYWLPVQHRSQAELRIFGTSTLEIDYGDYRVAGPVSWMYALDSDRCAAGDCGLAGGAVSCFHGNSDGVAAGTEGSGTGPVDWRIYSQSAWRAAGNRGADARNEYGEGGRGEAGNAVPVLADESGAGNDAGEAAELAEIWIQVRSGADACVGSLKRFPGTGDAAHV